MNIIQIDPPTNFIGEFTDWQKSVAEKLGLKDWRRVYCSRRARRLDFTWVGGVLYQRMDSNLAHLHQTFFHPVFAADEPGAPGVLCPCGETRFTLHNEDWVVIARCSSCGKEGSVNDMNTRRESMMGISSPVVTLETIPQNTMIDTEYGTTIEEINEYLDAEVSIPCARSRRGAECLSR